jgi:hypothetical protein
MGAKKVDLKRLAAALVDYDFAYLITVGNDYRVHTVTVEPVLRDGLLDVGLVGGRTCNNLANRSHATLLWPPRELGGYSLIVDGRTTVTDIGDETVQLEILPTPRAAASQRHVADSRCGERPSARLRGVF